MQFPGYVQRKPTRGHRLNTSMYKCALILRCTKMRMDESRESRRSDNSTTESRMFKNRFVSPFDPGTSGFISQVSQVAAYRFRRFNTVLKRFLKISILINLCSLTPVRPGNPLNHHCSIDTRKYAWVAVDCRRRYTIGTNIIRFGEPPAIITRV